MNNDTTEIITALGVECYKTDDATPNEELRALVDEVRGDADRYGVDGLLVADELEAVIDDG